MSESSREKLEKIKDLYLTVEAIGDDNVGKHFDELMQRQRELISDYFKETGIGSGRSRAHQPDPRRQNDGRVPPASAPPPGPHPPRAACAGRRAARAAARSPARLRAAGPAPSAPPPSAPPRPHPRPVPVVRGGDLR